jgi:hypothetical protein
MRPQGEGRLVPIPPRARAAAPPRWPVRLFGLALLLAAATLLIAARPAAAAKTPCWLNVVQDWYADGSIDRVYERHCYTEALKNVGEDVKVYSSFEEDIKAALQRAARANLRSVSSSGSRDGDALAPRVGRNEPRPGDGLFQMAFDKSSPRNADSMPVPLLILGGLALLLIAAGAAGLLRRRLRARRPAAP